MAGCFLTQRTMQFNLVWIALAISLVATIPQLVQVIQTKEARDFNTTYLLLSLLANGLIGIEAYQRGAKPMIALSAWLFVYWAIILGYKVHFSGV